MKKLTKFDVPIYPNTINLSQEARNEVYRVMRDWLAEHGKRSYTYADLARLTGYDSNAIRATLKFGDKKWLPEIRRKNSRKKPSMAKPEFVTDVERVTGLTAYLIRESSGSSEWVLRSPQNSPLVYLIGTGDLLQIVRPALRYHLQGLSRLQVKERSEAKRTKYGSMEPEELLEELFPEEIDNEQV